MMSGKRAEFSVKAKRYIWLKDVRIGLAARYEEECEKAAVCWISNAEMMVERTDAARAMQRVCHVSFWVSQSHHESVTSMPTREDVTFSGVIRQLRISLKDEDSFSC